MHLMMQVLVAAWILHVIGRRSRMTACLLAFTIFIPLGDGHYVATAMRGFWGDPSLTSIQLMLLCLFGKTPPALRDDWREPAILVLSGGVLYASALGPGDIDIYRFGYQPIWLVVWFGASSLAAWWRGYPLYLWLLVIDLLAWHAGWMETTNFWDILIDPLLIFSMVAIAFRNGTRSLRKRNPLPDQP